MTTITLPRAVVEQALHVAESAAYPVALIKALRAALAQQDEPVQEPVAWLAPRIVDSYSRPDLGYETCSKSDYGAFPAYTAPPQRKLVPLTEEEIFKIENDIPDDVISDRAWTICLTRAVEKAVWEKNHGQA